MRILRIILVMVIAVSVLIGLAVAAWFAAMEAGWNVSLETLVEIIASLVSSLALAGLIYSVHMQGRSIDSVASASVAARQIEVDRLFIDRPHLRPYFLENQTILEDDKHFQEACAAANLIANFFDTYFIGRKSDAQMFGESEWIGYMQAHLKGSPILRAHIRDRSDWYTAELHEFMRDAVGDRSEVDHSTA